ncbi:MAG: hypothetical protein Ct9H300mP27_12200 [Chloroflexota bacterium]|nr:MAG: hypothetical protein Ct9H300mP27_12200 [Chloroflexota bacterium]
MILGPSIHMKSLTSNKSSIISNQERQAAQFLRAYPDDPSGFHRVRHMTTRIPFWVSSEVSILPGKNISRGCCLGQTLRLKNEPFLLTPFWLLKRAPLSGTRESTTTCKKQNSSVVVLTIDSITALVQ